MAVKKKTEEKNVCTCTECKCNSNEFNFFMKGIFYTLVGILVLAFISTVSIIIFTVDNHNNGKNRNTSSLSEYSSDGNGSSNGTESNNTESKEYDVSMFEQITVNQLLELYNGPEKSLIYIGRPTCGWCVEFLPSLQAAQAEFGYKTYYYDLDTITQDDYNTLTSLNTFLANTLGSTPMVMVVQNGTVLSADGSGEGWVGYADYDTFKSYLQGLGY